MDFVNEPIFQWLAQYAYQPTLVYLAVFGMMIASGFGLPLPEEVTIVSVGLIAYMGAHPELFPPPYEGAPVVHGLEAALVTTLSVVFADMLVFSIGRVFGRKIIKKPFFSRFFSPEAMEKINKWVKRRGIAAAFIFRFTPGIRFPAHVILGASHFSVWQFALVDGFAALISIPTQIVLIYYYGESILTVLHRFKVWFGVIIFLAMMIYLLRRWMLSRTSLIQKI